MYDPWLFPPRWWLHPAPLPLLPVPPLPADYRLPPVPPYALPLLSPALAVPPYAYPMAQAIDRQQVPEHMHGPERAEERAPHARIVNWAGLFPSEVFVQGPPRKIVALTFDDGPDDTWTPRIVEVLNRYNIKGTFFCVGQRVQANPQVLRQMHAHGHILGNHSWNHPNFTKIPLADVTAQITRTGEEIFRVAGVRPALVRPPYGAMNEDVIHEIMRLHYKIIYWDVDSLDWDKLTAAQVEHNVLAHSRPGSIILHHSAGGRGESLEDTVLALPVEIERLRAEGYRFVTIPELLGIPAYQTAQPAAPHATAT